MDSIYSADASATGDLAADYARGCATGDLEEFRRLANRSPGILTHEEPSGRTMLHVVAEAGRLNIAQYLLDEKPALMDKTYGEEGYTALHLAAKMGKTDIIRAIINKTFAQNPNAEAIKRKTSAGETILHLMAKHGQRKAFTCTLLAYGLRELAKETDQDGNTVLHFSVKRGSIRLMRFILKEKVVRVNTHNNMGTTARNIAIEEHNHPEFGEIIVALRDAHCITGRGGRFWSRREAPDKHLHGVLNTTVVAAALIAALAFSALLNPPGGVYQEGALAGRAILSTHRLFDVFLFFNVIALVTSLAIVVMLSTYVAFTRDSFNCRWDVSQTLTDVIGAWLIYCRTTKKFPAMITLTALVFASIGATVVNYLMWKLRIRVPHLQKFIKPNRIPAQAVDDQKEDEELLI